MVLYRVILPYACFGIEVENGIITKSAPIGKWSVGRTLKFFEIWVKNKGGTVEIV